MVAAFLAAEATSPRFGERIHATLAALDADIDLVAAPNIVDPAANAVRRQVLAECRGFPDREVFTGVPANTCWYQAQFAPADLDSKRYINWDWWLQYQAG